MLTIEQEHQIVKQILDGDIEQYALIVREYQEHVSNLCYRLVGDKLDVEEVVQQVFVELYSALPRFRYQAKLSTFIYRMTVNVVSKSLKHSRRFLSYDNANYVDNHDDQLTREEQIEKDEQYKRLHSAIGQLKYEQRTALVLFAFKGLSYQDVADVMQVSLSKVESLIFRAKKNLYKLLTQ